MVTKLVPIFILLCVTPQVSVAKLGKAWLVEVASKEENNEHEKTTQEARDGFDYVTVNIFLVVGNLKIQSSRQLLVNQCGIPTPF